MAPVVQGVTECLYVTLGVERDVDAATLKSAYRQLARALHPDKVQQSGGAATPEAYQEVTERFQAIQRAYEVLSDPVERAWYDSHRGQILDTKRVDPGEYDLDLWVFFSPRVFSGYGDDEYGFYAVYGELFRDVDLREQMFARAHGSVNINLAPELGGRDAPYASVQAFYQYWKGFSSVRDFAWCDKFDVSDAPNRKARRIMEEKNSRIRHEERKEFNVTVRQLAAFVKKRDKRVIEKQLELQKLRRQKEVERWNRQIALEQEKQEQIRLYREQARAAAFEQEWETEEDSDDAAKVEKSVEDSECLICGKRFKSVKQLQNHERSKKHLENLAALRGAFRNDDENAERLGEQLGIDIPTKKKRNAGGVDASSDTSQPEVEVAAEPLRMPSTCFDDAEPSIVADEEDDVTSGREPSLDVSDAEDGDDDDGMLASMLKLQRNRPTSASEKAVSESSPDDEEDDTIRAAMSNLELNKKAASSEARQSDDDSVEEVGASPALDSDEEEEKAKKGKSRRRAKQDRKQAAVASRFAGSETGHEQQPEASATNGDATSETGGPSTGANESSRVVKERQKLANRGKKIKKEKKGAKQDSHTCQTCEEDFDSRSQLFKHIAATNHAILKSK